MSDILDSPNQVDPSEVSFFSTALRYGLIAGLVGIVVSMIAMSTGLMDFSKGFVWPMVIGVISFAILIVITVMGVRHHRDKELGGYANFGRMFLVAGLIVLIAGVLGTIFNYAYFNFIDPDYLANASDGVMEMYENMGMSDDQVETAMEQFEKQMEGQSNPVKGLLGNVIASGIIGAIIGLIMKKNPPVNA